MPFLLPILALTGTGLFAVSAGNAVGDGLSKYAKWAALAGGAYVAYKIYKG